MKYPVKIYQCYRKKTFDLLVFINDTCNYNCYYCYNNKPRTLTYINLDNLYIFILYILKIQKLDIFIELIGGEPTLHPQLLDFCKKISTNKRITCGIYTNFTAHTNIYKILLQYNINLTITWHSQFNIQLFINKLKEINANNFSSIIDIRIMLENLNFNKCINAYNLIKKQFIEPVELALLDYNLDTFKISHTNNNYYTKKQLHIFNNIEQNMPKLYTIEYNDNSIENISINIASNIKKYMSFKYWICEAGKNFLYIDYNGNIYKCQAFLNKNPLANINNYNSILSFQLKNTLCPVDICHCLWEISKYNIFNKKNT